MREQVFVVCYCGRKILELFLMYQGADFGVHFFGLGCSRDVQFRFVKGAKHLQSP
jgi:hypothetical protein